VPGGDLTQPFTITALIGLAAFTAFLIKDQVQDLRKQRDAALASLTALTASVDKLADIVKDGFRDIKP
jgi:uncharacterized membrane protein